MRRALSGILLDDLDFGGVRLQTLDRSFVHFLRIGLDDHGGDVVAAGPLAFFCCICWMRPETAWATATHWACDGNRS